MKLDASDARNRAARAISSGVAMRFRACMFSTKAMISGVWANSRPASVSVPPGNRQLLRTPCAPNSAAMTRDRPTSPALAAA
ncbi:hypothetical protein D3C85_1748700 [compost metagenome]